MNVLVDLHPLEPIKELMDSVNSESHYVNKINLVALPSTCFKIASARLLQFHLVDHGDSGEIVTSFMRDGNYPSRNFAQLFGLYLN